MRRLVALSAVLVLLPAGGCANMGAPPGGPERTTPPVLLSVSPDSGATNVRDRGVVFEFDVVVSDRDVSRFFVLSPRDGNPRINWRRNRVEVRPRRDFRPNTAYSVTMLPGIPDLRGNVMRTGKTVVFSTGPTIPGFLIAGRVFDWMNMRAAPNALIEVIRRPDSLPFEGTADSTGQFAVGPLDEGTYTVRAILDNNRNRAIDPGESWDSLAVVVRGTSPFVELLAAQRDTIPPRLLTVSARDSLSVLASFDRPLHPADTLGPASFRVIGSDSVPLRIVAVTSRVRADSADAAARAARDTTTRRDTTARDTTRRDTTARAPELPPTPSRPPPLRDVVLRLDSLTPLRPASAYRITALNVRGLLGPSRTSERVLSVPVARRDSTPPAARPPTARPPTVRPP